MAKRSSVDIVFEVDKADDGVLTSGLTPYITKMGDLVLNRGTVDVTPFGTDDPEYLLGVLKKYESFDIEFVYDDAAEPAPNAVFDITRYTHAVTRSFSLTIGGSRVYTGELWIHNYKIGLDVGSYHTCTASLQFTRVITVA